MAKTKITSKKTPSSAVAEEPGTRGWSAAPTRHCMMAVLLLLSLLFLISLFKNISYPLFWADESMTVMGGTRVLKYGYPKVHDGKNVFYDLLHPDQKLGIDERTDAYIGGASWGMYYVAALGVKLAELSNDMYVRTGLLRFLFALSGLGGVILWAIMGVQLFRNASSRIAFLACFAFLTLISVPLVLHLREVRYYSLTVLLTAVAAYIYGKHRLLNQMSFRRYSILQTVSLVLLYLVFYPAYIVFLVTIAVYECVLLSTALFEHSTSKETKKGARTSSIARIFKSHLFQGFPLLVSLIAVFPLMLFFRTFHVSTELSEFYAAAFRTDVSSMYLVNLRIIWKYFSSVELIYMAIFLKALLLLLYIFKKAGKKGPGILDRPRTSHSLFLTLFFIVYCFAIAKIPNPLFTRYVIPLQPVLSLIIILDGAIVYRILSHYQSLVTVFARRLLILICAGLVLLSLQTNFKYIRGHAYELFHRYEGPLDHVIPFIKKEYPDASRLVIATNYEETSFMYYLDAKVVVGYVGNNLEEDARATPDIIVYRQFWGKFGTTFSSFLARSHYELISFPVFDYPFNNIPELNWRAPFRHQFRTLESHDEEIKTRIFLRRSGT